MTTIVLNDSLEAYDTSREVYIPEHMLRKYKRVERSKILKYIDGSVNSLNLHNHGLFGLLSHAYTYHIPVAINPTDLWILIISQLKTIIKDNAETYRHLFTDSTEKKEISVPTNSTYELPVSLIADQLNELLNFDTDLIRTKFSTDTEMGDEVKEHLLLDMSSPYYSYTMFLCGIPSIKIGGTVEDWILLENQFLKLNEIFYNENDEDYIRWQYSVNHIVSQFASAVEGEYDIHFFEDIYTQSNIGSGNELTINGWIVDLFYKQPRIAKIENFNSHASCVEYKNKTTNTDYVMISGGFSYDTDSDGFINLAYSKHIFSVVNKEG